MLTMNGNEKIEGSEGCKSGHTLRLGNRRASYRPEWSASLPWATYENGSAGIHLSTKYAAIRWLIRGNSKLYDRIEEYA